MRMIKKSIVVATALFFSMTMIQTNVDAASKKLKVNTVYDTTTKIKGKTKKKYLVKVKIGEKIYKKKARQFLKLDMVQASYLREKRSQPLFLEVLL